jgi:hypothetical protein
MFRLAEHDPDLLDDIRAGWGWRGIRPVGVVAVNNFGNLIVKDDTGRSWRICPEECDCYVIAETDDALDILNKDQEFLKDWFMSALVDHALLSLGAPPAGRCYCLKIPAVLGGAYEPSNFGTITLSELMQASGDIAQQIHDLPDGAQVRLIVTK